MNIKLVAIDIDGTLLHDDFTLSARNKQMLKRVKERQIPIVLASGRSPVSCLPLSADLGISDPLIAHNGAVIYDPQAQRTVLEFGFPASDLQDMIQYCRQHQIQYDVNTAFDLYVDWMNPEFMGLYEKFYIEPKWVDDCLTLDEQVVKFTLTGSPEQMDRALLELSPSQKNRRIIRSGETFIDIIHSQATKGYALQKLLSILEIPATDVLAFGNYYNDIEMLTLSGLGVAMQNSPQEVLAQADRVAPANNEDGVARVLEDLLV
jgi:Cof subfamily protein (haloacid dehalogenase superfamily)